jgi:hypothetical protein
MATEPASLIPLMKGVRYGVPDYAWPVDEFALGLTVTTCGVDRRPQAATTCDPKSRSPVTGIEHQSLRASDRRRRYVLSMRIQDPCLNAASVSCTFNYA